MKKCKNLKHWKKNLKEKRQRQMALLHRGVFGALICEKNCGNDKWYFNSITN